MLQHIQRIQVDARGGYGRSWGRRRPGRWWHRLEERFRRSVRSHLSRILPLIAMDTRDGGEPEEPRIRFVVSGRVQGVGFRAWALRRGQELGVRGWVRNCRDGAVEVEAAGPLSALLQLRDKLSDGPPLAKVMSIRDEPPKRDPLPDKFEIR